MKPDGALNLPEGLPARFVDPKAGFTLLCDFLDIAGRREQQKIVKIEGVKRAIRSRKTHVRSLPTSKRLQAQITMFYCLPHERRNLWRYYFQNVMLDEIREFPLVVPSLEYKALKRFDSDFLYQELNETDIEKSLADFPGTFESVSNSPDDWQLPALAVWPKLRRDLHRWEMLPPIRQDTAALATFAVATILDDIRFLDWAANQTETLKKDYAFALDGKGNDAQAAPVHYVGENLSNEDETREIVRRWNEACTAITEITSEIGSDLPQLERLDDLIEQVHVLEDLRESMNAALDGLHSEKLVGRVLQAVAKMATEKNVSWLAQYAGKIQAQWKLFYIVPDDVDMAQLGQDVERVENDIKDVMSEWQTTEDDLQSSRQRLQELEGSAYGAEDLLSVDDRKVEIQVEIAEATRRHRDARLQIFRVIAPGDQRFDPSRDYEREYDDTSVVRPDREHEEVVQGPVDRPDWEGDAETTAPTSEPKYSRKASEKPLGTTDDDRPRERVPHDASNDEEDAIVEMVTSKLPDSDTDLLAANLTPVSGESRVIQPFSHGDGPVATGGTEGAVVSAPIDESGSPDAAAVTALWQAIDAGRPGIAYHIARLSTERGEDTRTVPPANLIAASALADHVHFAHGEVVTTLRPLLESIDPDSLSSNARQDRVALNLLLFCATLRPALFAPYTGAAAMLRRIGMPETLTPVYQLAKAVADHADRLQGVRLDADLIGMTLRGGWRDEFMTFAARVVDWRDRAESQKIIFDRANRVWHDLFRETGCLAELAALMSKDDAAGTDRIEEIRKRIGDHRSLNDLVRQTDRKHRKGNPIQGRALKQLWDHVQPAIDLSSEWLRLMDAKPDSEVFITRRIEALRTELLTCGKEAIEATERAATTETTAASAATLKLARNTIDALLQVFEDDAAPVETVNEPPNVIRSRDLLYVTGLDLDIEYRPVACHDGADVLDLLLDRSSHAETLSDAFDARLARGDLIGADLACKGMDADDHPEADRCRTSFDREMERERGELRRTHADEESRLEHAFCRGQIDIDKRDELAARLVSLKQLVQPVSSYEQTLNLVSAVAGAKSKLADIRQSIEAAAVARIVDARKRLDTATFSDRGLNERASIEQIIESGDLLAANELMSRMEQGESVILPAVADDPFQEFISIVEKIEQALGASGNLRAQLVRRVAAREHIAGISFENLSDEEAKYAASLLEAWYTLSRQRRAEKQPLQDLLQRLGFKVGKLTLSNRGRTQADVETETVEDRALCPSRQFGSEARGHYRILLNWNRPDMDSIVASLGVTGGAPTLVLHFGCLGDDRENLRKLALQTHRLFLVIDEPLMLFLTARPSGRLSALFRTALPFTSVEPYATTSSLVPPELFYGRERELQEITDQSGTCFIYGGRQLGKTALLRRVEKDFNRSRQTNVAKWIDLKVNEIGYARGPRDIWPLLQRELASVGVVQKPRREMDPENRKAVDSLLDRIRRWLDERENRRLLLLLDEADAFLEQDGRAEFRESSRLKGLMDGTERRFKVVFAGLHNVLRTVRQANHPLAHLGDPIRVGAMLSNGEWRQAQALVREPLQAVGCRFARDELSTRILAQTNYYPSLIQLYGAELVRRLRDSKKVFPYAIDDEDISAAYSSRELSSAIRERFLLTLQLDPRYEVIAYAVTQELHGEAELDRGLEPDTVAEAAKAWWPEGFEVTDEEFLMLLHEMEGLGVLRSINEGRRYTLRNPNILLLLGNSDDIEKTLTKERQPPAGFEPAAFRARYPKKHLSSKRRGPLTYRQETDLRARGGLAVICGCRAAGLERVEEFLRQRIEPELFRTLQTVSDLDEFERELKELRPVRNMVTVCLVALTADWDTSWVAAAKRIQQGKAQGRSTWSKVVFTATPEMLWRMFAGDSELGGMERIEIGPWDKRFLRHWLEDINFTADADHVHELMETSGGWPAVLDKFGEKPPRKSWSTRIEELERELVRDRTMQDFGIHSEEVERILGTLLSEEAFDFESIEVASVELGMEHAEIKRRVEWSERLGLVSGDGDGRWTFNPLIRRLLEAHDPE